MGRMLDSMKQAENHRKGSVPPRPREMPSPPQVETDVDLLTPDVPEEDDVPYIEVGAPGKKIEGSPAVLALPRMPQPKLKISSPEPSTRTRTGTLRAWLAAGTSQAKWWNFRMGEQSP